jgi:hypothetical protein
VAVCFGGAAARWVGQVTTQGGVRRGEGGSVEHLCGDRPFGFGGCEGAEQSEVPRRTGRAAGEYDPGPREAGEGTPGCGATIGIGQLAALSGERLRTDRWDAELCVD